jgi:hypothetical protein
MTKEEANTRTGKRKTREEDGESEKKKGKRRQTESVADGFREWQERVDERLEGIELKLEEVAARIESVISAIAALSEKVDEINVPGSSEDEADAEGEKDTDDGVDMRMSEN